MIDSPEHEERESASDSSSAPRSTSTEVSRLVEGLRGAGESADAPERAKDQTNAPSTSATSSASPSDPELGDPADPNETAKPANEVVRALPIDRDDDLRGISGEASEELVSIIQSLLFAAPRPLRVRDIHRVIPEASLRQVQLALKHLMASHDESGIAVSQVAGGFVFTTHRRNAVWVQKLLQAKPQRLTRAQLETLAVISYRQPLTRPEIEHVRGVDSGAVLKMLIERDLIQSVGRREEPGRPLLYGTTVAFLEFFNLMSLDDLPNLREFEQLSDQTKSMLRNKMGEDDAERLGQQVLEFAATGSLETPAAQDGAPSDAASTRESTERSREADPSAQGDAEEREPAEAAPLDAEDSEPAEATSSDAEDSEIEPAPGDALASDGQTPQGDAEAETTPPDAEDSEIEPDPGDAVASDGQTPQGDAEAEAAPPDADGREAPPSVPGETAEDDAAEASQVDEDEETGDTVPDGSRSGATDPEAATEPDGET